MGGGGRNQEAYLLSYEQALLRYDRDAGQRSADRNRIEDARTYEDSDGQNLCPHYQRQNSSEHASVGGTVRRNQKNALEA